MSVWSELESVFLESRQERDQIYLANCQTGYLTRKVNEHDSHRGRCCEFYSFSLGGTLNTQTLVRASIGINFSFCFPVRHRSLVSVCNNEVVHTTGAVLFTPKESLSFTEAPVFNFSVRVSKTGQKRAPG